MDRSLFTRLGHLKTLLRLIEEEKTAIEAAHREDFRKCAFEVLVSETSIVRHEIKFLIASSARFLRARGQGVPLTFWPGRSRVYRVPLGRVLVLSPWNFPFMLALTPLVGAVACGNNVVLKPSELTPAVSRVVEDLVRRSFPGEVAAVVQGGADTAQTLLRDPWDLVFFTGSPQVGRIVARAAAETMSPTVLELGGKSPAIVLDGADIAVAARRILWGKVMNAGQTCVAPDYALVPRPRLQEFTAACRTALNDFFPQGAESSRDFAALVHERSWERLDRLVDPVRVVVGGGRDRSRRYFGPAVLSPVTWDDPIMREEIFGPVLPVLTHDGYDDALAQIANAPNPLAAYAFGPAKTARAFLAQFRAGGGAVNDVVTHFSHPRLPFGGLGSSGSGQYHGRWSLETFTRPRGLLEQPRRLDWPLRYPPYGGVRAKLVDFLLH